jgi:hypothetical protein
MNAPKHPVNPIHSAFPAAGASCCDLTHNAGLLVLDKKAPLTREPSFGGDTSVRFDPLVSLFAASLIALLPAQALAQELPSDNQPQANVSVRDRARPDYDPLGVRLGAFNLNAAVDFGVASTDNLFAAETNEQDDIRYTVAPTARLASNWSRHEVAVEGGASWVRHDDFDNEDYDTQFFRARGRFDVGNATQLGASARFAHDVKPRTAPDTPSVGNPVEFDRVDYAAFVEHRFARFNVRAEGGHINYDYDGTQSFLDSEESMIRGRIEAEVSPMLGIVGQVTLDEREYENSPDFDSEGQTYLVGVSLNGDLFKGEVLVGSFDRDYNMAYAEGVAVAASLEWYVTQLTTITVTGRHDADDHISADFGSPYITEQVGVRVDHELLRNVILGAGVEAGNRTYAVDREDEFVNAEVGADYFLNRRVALRARYEYDESESTGFDAGRSFDASTISLGLRVRL